MLRYKLIKWTRAVRIFFGGYKSMEEAHKLFQMDYASRNPILIIEDRLKGHGYYYNALSTTYKKQCLTVRKLVDHDHQYHLRFYETGWVSGHYELQPIHSLEHLDGIELRSLNEQEKEELWELLSGENK